MKLSSWMIFTLSALTIMTLLESPVLAGDDTTDIQADPHHQGVLSTVNLGIRYSSLIERHGVIFYRDFQIDPVVGVFLFNDKLEYLGDSFGYCDFVAKDWLRLRTRVVAVSDKPLFPYHDSVKDGSPDRPDTYEWTSTAEFFIPGYNNNYTTELDLEYAKDISINHGNYLELQAKIKLFRFRVPLAQTLIEPNLYSAVGWGDAANNQYYYGPSANKSSFNNLSYGLWFAFPEEADRFYPIIQIKHFETLGDNRNTEYASGRDQGWLFSFIATGGLL